MINTTTDAPTQPTDNRRRVIQLDPHVDGSCALTLTEDEAIALRDALIEWLG